MNGLSEELKRCPFCDGEGLVCSSNFERPSRVYSALCANCRAGPGESNTRAEAIAAWNTRAEGPRPARAEGDREAIARLLADYFAHRPWEDMASGKGDLRARIRDGYDVNEPTRDECYAAADAILALSPATEGKEEVERLREALAARDEATRQLIALRLSRPAHDDLCRLSVMFGRASDLRTDQDIRINEWLKAQIADARAALSPTQPITAHDTTRGDQP